LEDKELSNILKPTKPTLNLIKVQLKQVKIKGGD